MVLRMAKSDEKRVARSALPASIVLLDLSHIALAFDTCEDTVRAWVRKGEFPPPIYPTPSSNVGKWTLATVEAHLAKRQRGRRVRKQRGFQRLSAEELAERRTRARRRRGDDHDPGGGE
jgi:hypothetical protein